MRYTIALAFWLAATCTTGYAQQRPVQVLQKHVRAAITDKRAAFVSNLAADRQMQISVVLPLRNQNALNSLLARLYDPTSADYRKFLSVAQFTDQFGPTVEDYQAVVDFAQANGLTVTGTFVNRLVVSITGSAQQVNDAFHVQMGVYQHPTENRTFYSPDREPSLALNVPVAHISGLDDYSLPQPLLVKPQSTQAEAPNVAGSGPGGSYLGSDMRAAYYGGTQLTGTGQTVGILAYGGYLPSDVDKTFTNAGQSYTVPIVNVLLNGETGAPSGSYGDGEQVLDIAQAIGMAPGLSQVRVYIGRNDTDMLNSMASENLAKQLSCSWAWLPPDPQVDDPFFQEMAAQGQSFFTASGDAGAFDLSVSPYVYPADDQYVTAVGGTHLTTSGVAGSWVSETAWNSNGYGSGGGISTNNIGIPSWQAGLATTANGGSTTLRNVPDVAMEGDFDNYACNLGSCAGGYAGTSFASPRWAGFMALVNQQAVEANTAPNGLGFINPTIYQIAKGSHAASDLHDIVSGNNKTSSQSVWYSAVPGYDLVTGYGSANGQSLIDDLAGPQIPGFWIAGSKSTVVVNPGGSGSNTLTITGAGGFTGNVSFAVTSTLPNGVTASFSPSNTATATELAIAADSSVPNQKFIVTVTGTSGNLSATTSFSVSVHAPSFLLSASPSTVGINQSGTSTATVTVTPQYGFAGSVALAVSGLPSGVIAAFSPASTTGTSTLTLTANSTVPGGNSTVTVTGTSGSLTTTTTFTLSVHAPSFTLSGTSTIDIGQGRSGSAYVYVQALYGFTGSVNFSVSGLPTGVTASFAPNPASSTTYLTLTAANDAPVGSSTLTITGTSGSLTATTTLTLGIHAPSFTLSGGGTLSVGQASSGTSYVYVNAQYGFTGSVNLAVTGLPAGVSAVWNPNPTTGSSTLTIAASTSATPGQYSLTITGTSGSQTASTTLSLGVFVPTFTLYGSNSVSIGQGTTTTTYTYVNAQYGFTGSVNLAITGLPSGVTATFTPNPTTYSSTLTLQASSNTTIGQYTATITGTSGTQTATAQLTIGVYRPTFTLSSYSSVTIGRGSSSNAYVYVNPQYGFTGSVTMSVAGLPSGVTATFSPNPTTGNSTVTLAASSTAALGQYTVTVTGTSGSQTASTNITVGIYDPTFTLSGSSSVTVGQGTSSTAYVYVNPQYGFTGSVTMSVAGLPSGITAAFSPNPTTGSSTLTIAASSAAAVGQYSLTITGTSGGITVTAPLTLSIYVPTFTLSAGSVSVGQGSSSSTYVNVNPQYGFNGAVNLSVSGLPSGVTAAFSPNPSTGYGQLVISASSAAAVGSSTLTITGTYGSTTATTTLALGVYTPGFTLYGSSSLNLDAGTSGTSYVYITPQYGFTGNVTLTASGLPSGVTASFSPNPTTYSSNLTLTANSSATAGNSVVTITGTSGTATASIILNLTVYASSYTLVATPAQINLVKGGAGKSTFSIVPVHGFAGSVSYSAANLPSGVVATFSPNPTTGNTTLTLAAGTNAPSVSAATVTVTGTSGTLTASKDILVNVTAAPPSTTTTLALTTGGAPATSITAGSAVTATATVTAGNTTLTAGEVNFCDATSTLCDDLHRLASAPITSAGKAVLRFVPGPGSHSYRASFRGTSTNLVSISGNSALSVSGAPTSTAIAQTGSAGNYTLTATVTGTGMSAPTGNVSFLDTGNGNTAVANANLGAGTASLTRINTQSPATGTAPSVAATGDFNNDGFPDLVVGNYVSTMTVLLGKGDGTFTTAPTVSTPGAPSFIVAGDFNRDGNTDLAMTFTNINTVILFLGAGDGTFRKSDSTPLTGSNPNAMAMGDYNRDGIQDLAVVNYGSGTLTILLGNGDGTFTASNLSPQVGSSPSRIVQADWNGDGIPDLAVTTSSGYGISILLGVGDGTFAILPQSPTNVYTNSMAVGDLNQDGKADLVLGGLTSGSTIALGNGDGTFTTVPQIAPTGGNPYPLAIADVNGDGKLDLVAGNQYSSIVTTVTTVLGNGDGTFGQASTSPIGVMPTAILIGDWNGDGIQDIATPNYGSHTVTVLTTKLTQSAKATVTGVALAGTGAHAIAARYSGDGNFTSSLSATTSLNGPVSSPTINLNLSAANITTVQALTVTVTVSGSSATVTPTGSVTLTSGSYTSAATALSSGVATITVPAGALLPGTDPITVNYTPDIPASALYAPVSTSSSVVVTKSPIALALVLSATNITTVQPLSVAAAITGGSSNALATGTVTLTSGTYTSGAIALTNAAATITVPAGALPVGSNTLQGVYTPTGASAALYSSSTQAATVTVTNAIGTAVPTVSVKAGADTITNLQTDLVTVTLTGASGQPVPSGTITLSSGSYRAQQALASGAAAFTVPAGALGTGANTLTATYNGDAGYAAASGTATVTVAPMLLAASTASPVAAGATTTSAITLTAGSNYSGTVALTCTLAASPSGAQSLPGCTLNPGSVTLASSGTATATVTVTTTAATKALAVPPVLPGRRALGYGGSVLALVLCFGIPRRGRAAAVLMLLLVLTTVGMTGCAGGSGGSSQPVTPVTPVTPTSTPATTAGTYTFTVTGTDSTANLTTSANVTVVVQ